MILYIKQIITLALNRYNLISINLNMKRQSVEVFNLSVDKEIVLTLYRER
jgi:hypothetical protein